MSKEDIEKFRADVENDPALLSELQGHQDQAAFVSKATSLARSRGYDISEDEIHSYLASNQQGELSDEALKSVAGGTQGNLGKYTYSRPGCNSVALRRCGWADAFAHSCDPQDRPPPHVQSP